MTLGGSLQWWVHFQQSDGGFTQKGKTVRKTKNGGFTFWAMVGSLQNPWWVHMEKWWVHFLGNGVFTPKSLVLSHEMKGALTSVSRKFHLLTLLTFCFKKTSKCLPKDAKSRRKKLQKVTLQCLPAVFTENLMCHRHIQEKASKCPPKGAKGRRKKLQKVTLQCLSAVFTENLMCNRFTSMVGSLWWWVHFNGSFTSTDGGFTTSGDLSEPTISSYNFQVTSH